MSEHGNGPAAWAGEHGAVTTQTGYAEAVALHQTAQERLSRLRAARPALEARTARMEALSAVLTDLAHRHGSLSAALCAAMGRGTR